MFKLTFLVTITVYVTATFWENLNFFDKSSSVKDFTNFTLTTKSVSKP